MISPQTISAIFDTVRIEDVVGEFVSLKKRGANYIGLCPFHNEKTPSFSVNPARNIFKCFGCGKGGDSVKFIMEHEHYTYPEALKYLAKKYNIEIEETEQTPEQKQEQSEQEKERESLYIVSAFAEQFFIDNLHNTDEGKSIGLSYFKERGFSDETIKKFRLGYSLNEWDALMKAATDAGYKLDYLEKTGLVKSKDAKHYDGFRGRVMFPIHNLSGRVIGFGGRVLRKDEKTAKYINTPECEIYHKSKTLYGIYFAKKAIIEKDNCLLVEGYTDVISLHQSGIENVVASSGTSLTQEQIRLIGRYTKNITILYDGDAAGIKASFRGIDMILEEGMNVRSVLFPDGEDPDSFSKKVSNSELENFIAENSKDFIVFKADLLLKEAKNNPSEKVKFVNEILQTIAHIPEPIKLNEFAKNSIKKCSKELDIAEVDLYVQFNRIRKNVLQNKIQNISESEKTKELSYADEQKIIDELDTKSHHQRKDFTSNIEHQEREIIRLLLKYGDRKILVESLDEKNKVVEIETTVAEYIIYEVFEKDKLSFETAVLKEIFDEFVFAFNNEKELTAKYFINHSNEKIKSIAIEMVSSKYELHNWSDKKITVIPEELKLTRALKAIFSFKTNKLSRLIEETGQQMKFALEKGEESGPYQQKQKALEEAKKLLGKQLGRVVLK